MGVIAGGDRALTELSRELSRGLSHVFFGFFCAFPPHLEATVLELPRLFTKAVADAAAAAAKGVAGAIGTRAAKTVAGPADLEVEDIKKLGERAA